MAPSAARTFRLGRELGDDGSFRRQESAFRGRVSEQGSSPFPLEPGRYHLYVARACPWAHRTIIVRKLMGLEEAISISYLHPVRDDRGWAFSDPEHSDQINGFSFLAEAYTSTDPSFDQRVTVPVLWDKSKGVIVNNESGEIVRMLDTVFAPLARHPLDLYPPELRTEIDLLNERIYETVNNAVYKAGFTSSQEVYEREVEVLFSSLEELDARLASRRFLFGSSPVESDVRLFTTLVRFDAVYQIHFKCSRRKLIEYPHLWPYTRDLYQWHGIGETVDLSEIRAHYYRTHPELNPHGIVAVSPAARFDEPAGREAMG